MTDYDCDQCGASFDSADTHWLGETLTFCSPACREKYAKGKLPNVRVCAEKIGVSVADLLSDAQK